jgi:hypothetical protein
MHIKAILVLTIAFCAPASAVNMSFLKDAPITRLDSKELKAYNEFIGKTLSEGADGVAAEWTAPKTPFKGKVTPSAFQGGRPGVPRSRDRIRQRRPPCSRDVHLLPKRERRMAHQERFIEREALTTGLSGLSRFSFSKAKP